MGSFFNIQLDHSIAGTWVFGAAMSRWMGPISSLKHANSSSS